MDFGLYLSFFSGFTVERFLSFELAEVLKGGCLLDWIFHLGFFSLACNGTSRTAISIFGLGSFGAFSTLGTFSGY